MTEREQCWLWFISLTALGISCVVAFFAMTEVRYFEKISRLAHNHDSDDPITVRPECKVKLDTSHDFDFLYSLPVSSQ